MKQINCNMIQDLLPLYQEGLVSGQTKKEIDEHLQRCPQCRAVQEKNQQELFHQTDLLSNTNSKEKSALVLLDVYKRQMANCIQYGVETIKGASNFLLCFIPVFTGICLLYTSLFVKSFDKSKTNSKTA